MSFEEIVYGCTYGRTDGQIHDRQNVIIKADLVTVIGKLKSSSLDIFCLC